MVEPRLLDDAQYWPILIGLAVLIFFQAATFVLLFTGRGRG